MDLTKITLTPSYNLGHILKLGQLWHLAGGQIGYISELNIPGDKWTVGFKQRDGYFGWEFQEVHNGGFSKPNYFDKAIVLGYKYFRIGFSLLNPNPDGAPSFTLVKLVRSNKLVILP